MPPHRRQANVISTAAKRFSAPYPTWIIVIVLLYIIFFLPVMVFVLNAWWLEKYNESNIEIKNTLKLHKVQSLTSRVWHVYRRTVEVSRLSHYKPKVKHGSSDATYVEISNSGVPNSETLHGIYVGKPNMLLLHGSLLFHGLSSESQTLTNKEQVTDWSECDVCLYKVAKQDTLADRYESYANPVTDRACAWCVALLGLSMPGQKPLEYYCYSSSSSSNSGDECEDRNYQLITGGGNEDKSDESDESDIEFVSPSSAPM